MPKLIKILFFIIIVIAIGFLLNAASNDNFLKEFTGDSRVHSLDLEKYRTNPNPQ